MERPLYCHAARGPMFSVFCLLVLPYYMVNKDEYIYNQFVTSVHCVVFCSLHLSRTVRSFFCAVSYCR